MKSTFLKTGLSVAVLAVLAASGVQAESAPGADNGQKKGHVFKNPLAEKQAALRAKAFEAQLNGKANGRDKVMQVAKGQYVELAREGEDLIWTVLAEFNNLPHNSLPEPDRSVNNSTIWAPDFSQEYFTDMLFSEAPGANSMRNFYIEQSSNRYTVNGEVTDWVTVPGDAEMYDDDVPGGVWYLIEDSVNGWYDNMVSQGLTDAEIAAAMAKYDVWDRYDHDGDGDFNEPDGYIDHFQIVHAGEGEEAGGGVLGGAAIWSHRWYARFNLIGTAGPAQNPLGGVEIPGTGLWIGDYTVEPENGGVGVFAHEFAHDLGLPDLYDTGGGRNSTGFWTLMSSGSWLSDGTQDIGSKPGHMGGWEKFMLGWYNYEVAFAGERSVHKLGPAVANTKQAQGVFVVLPPKSVTEVIGAPFAGNNFYYSGSGDDLDNTLTLATTLGAGDQLTAKVNYTIEDDWDYAYVVISTDGGANWTTVNTNLSTDDDPNGQNFGHGIMGSTGGEWVDLSADLSAWAGMDVLVGFRYWTDGAVAPKGLMVDEIQIGAGPVYGAEADEGWVLDGFRVSSGVETALYSNYYLAENRTYMGYDSTLQTGPYNFGFADQFPDRVEHFPYQDGLLISYWDTSYRDNNVSAHPGAGLILPVDAHPEVTFSADGVPWRSRIQSFDSTFNVSPTDEVVLHKNSVASVIPSRPGNAVFNDLYDYWTEANGQAGVAVPKTGTEIRVVNTSAHGAFMEIHVSPVR